MIMLAYHYGRGVNKNNDKVNNENKDIRQKIVKINKNNEENNLLREEEQDLKKQMKFLNENLQRVVAA